MDKYVDVYARMDFYFVVDWMISLELAEWIYFVGSVLECMSILVFDLWSMLVLAVCLSE
jgi:hypothetical protein